jgi:hypothetical protein
VWDMHIYVMAKDLYPVKVHYSYESQLKRKHVPMIISLERDLLVQNWHFKPTYVQRINFVLSVSAM